MDAADEPVDDFVPALAEDEVADREAAAVESVLEAMPERLADDEACWLEEDVLL